MKIEGPGKTQSTSGTKKKGGTNAADGSFGDMLASETPQAAQTGASHTISRVDMLLMAQAVEDPTERAARGRMAARATGILDELEKIRTALLMGGLTVGHVIDIADVIAAHREKIMDPRLTAILDEIDLRAQIEIAKMRLAMEGKA